MRPKKIEKTMMQIVPAHPGWFIVEPLINEDFKTITGLDLSPVLAWSVEVTVYDDGSQYSYALPVGAEDYSGESALKRPDGTFLIPDSCWFDSEASLIKYWKERRRETQERERPYNPLARS